MLNQYVSKLNLPEGARILDVGCGTGGFGKAFQNLGFEVYGIDVAPRMVNLANKNGIQAIQGSILETLQYSSNTFDLVIAANVLHGFQSPERLHIYQEMARVSKGKILFHDYNAKRHLGVTIVEIWIEHGDYKNFIKKIPTEFHEVFHEVQIFKQKNSFSSWYLCENINDSV
ncbi:MAG: class I SAM-dependent methyltransferase [Promethearchaeota archaeon]